MSFGNVSSCSTRSFHLSLGSAEQWKIKCLDASTSPSSLQHWTQIADWMFSLPTWMPIGQYLVRIPTIGKMCFAESKIFCLPHKARRIWQSYKSCSLINAVLVQVEVNGSSARKHYGVKGIRVPPSASSTALNFYLV